MRESQDAENAARRAQLGSGQRGDKVRTYRFQDDRVVDHRIGKKVRLSDVLAGDLDALR
jgi:peptide chain release factor 1